MSKKKFSNKNKKKHNKIFLNKENPIKTKENIPILPKIFPNKVEEVKNSLKSHPLMSLPFVQAALIKADIEVLELLWKNFGVIFKNNCKSLLEALRWSPLSRQFFLILQV